MTGTARTRSDKSSSVRHRRALCSLCHKLLPYLHKSQHVENLSTSRKLWQTKVTETCCGEAERGADKSLSASCQGRVVSFFMMSAEASAAAADEVCASCGIAAIDDVKLKECVCNLVKYCSDRCQENNFPQHKAACQERLVERRERNLFEQPDSCYGDCPICCLPLSINPEDSVMMCCCCNVICKGCNYSAMLREAKQSLDHRCPFCREPSADDDEESHQWALERSEKNDPAALCQVGMTLHRKRDYEAAFEYLEKAAELGVAMAHFELSLMYHHGNQFAKKDMKKEVYHLEEAAIAGHPQARRTLGCIEFNNGRFERARKHWIIAANLGDHDSLKCVKELYADEHATKEDYASALRAYQAAVAATKSSEREAAKAFYQHAEAVLQQRANAVLLQRAAGLR